MVRISSLLRSSSVCFVQNSSAVLKIFKCLLSILSGCYGFFWDILDSLRDFFLWNTVFYQIFLGFFSRFDWFESVSSDSLEDLKIISLNSLEILSISDRYVWNSQRFICSLWDLKMFSSDSFGIPSFLNRFSCQFVKFFGSLRFEKYSRHILWNLLAFSMILNQLPWKGILKLNSWIEVVLKRFAILK